MYLISNTKITHTREEYANHRSDLEHSNATRKSNRNTLDSFRVGQSDTGSEYPTGCFWTRGSETLTRCRTLRQWVSGTESDTTMRSRTLRKCVSGLGCRIIRHYCSEPQRKMPKPYQMSSKNHEIWTIASSQHHGHPPKESLKELL